MPRRRRIPRIRCTPISAKCYKAKQGPVPHNISCAFYVELYVYVLDSLVLEVWPVEQGSKSAINISVAAGSDVTTILDCGNGDIEERFVQEADDFQADPLPFECTLNDVGSYTIEVYLMNRRSYVAASVIAEVDKAITNLDIAWSHTVFSQETCLTASATAGTRITVFWILDDTYALENYAETHSDLQQLCHNYTAKGYYDTELRICNSLSCTFKNLLIAVVDPLVNVAATVPDFQNHTISVDFVRTTTSGSFMTCECTFGDGEIQILYEETISNTYTYTHTYAQPDSYYWNMMCTNYLTVVNISGVIHVQNPILMLEATADNPKTYGGDWRVDFTMDNGTNVTCTISIKDSSEAVTNIPEAAIFKEYEDLEGYGLIADNLYTAGDYDITVSCSNLVHMLEKTISVTVDDVIQGTTLSSDLRYAAVSETVTFSISTTDGSRYSYTIDFGDGSASRTIGPGTESISPLSAVEAYVYPAPGYYVVTLIVSNTVSNETVTIEVGVEYPIADAFTISDPNNVVYNTDQVDLVISWDNSLDEPSSVELNWDFKYDNLVVTEALNLVSSEHHIILVFPYYTFYQITVHIANNISAQDLSAEVRVGEPITGLAIVFPDSSEYNVNATPSVSSEFDAQWAIAEMTLSITAGSNVIFNIYCGDGQHLQVNRISSTWDTADTQPITCEYPTPGDYEVTVHAINNLTESNITATTPNQVNVEHPVPRLTLTTIEPQNINSSQPTCYTLTKDSVEYAPTDAACTFDYADGTQEVEPLVMSGDTFEHCHKDIVLPGNYTIMIECKNKVLTDAQDVIIMFQRNITGLNVTATNYTVEDSRDATIVIEVEDGSHMIIEVIYGDGQRTTITSHHGDSTNNYMPLLSVGNRFLHTHVYTEGNYTFTVNIQNSVSNVTVSGPEYFIIQYKMEDLTMLSLLPINMSGPVGNGTICVTVEHSPGPTDAFCTYFDLPFDTVPSRTYYAAPLRTLDTFCFTYLFPYASLGPRRLDCKCGNKINYIFRSMDVQVIECIRNVTLKTEKTHSIFNCYYNVSQNITFTLTVNNGSDFGYVFNTRDEATYTRFEDHQLQYRGFPFTRDLYYSYSLPGKYWPDTNVSNVVCTSIVVNECGTITIQYPIPEIQCVLESDIIEYPFEEFRMTVVKDEADKWTDPSVTASIGVFNVTNTGNAINFRVPNEDRSLYGENHLTCIVFNNVSTQTLLVPFIMQEFIGVLKFSPNNTYLAVGEELSVTMNLTNGTHVKFKLNFNTAGEEVKFYNHSQPLNSTQNYSVNHTYVEEGNFTVNITACNNVNSTWTTGYFPVMAKIHPNISLTVENRIITSPPGIVRYSVYYPQDAVVKPGHVFMTWDIGDDSELEVIYTENFKHAPDYAFHREVTLSNFPSGILHTKVNFTNAVSSVLVPVELEVYTLITGVEVSLDNKVVISTDEAFNVTCRAGKGSNMTLSAHFGDGNSSAEVFMEGYQEIVQIPFTHTYKLNGTYHIVCNYDNRVNNTNGSRSIDVERPIPSPEHINVTCPPAIANPPGKITCTIDIMQPYKPMLNLSDEVDQTRWLVTNWPYTFTTSYPEEVTGDYNITFIFENRVSYQEVVVTVHFEERLENASLECPPNSTLGTNQTGVSTGEVVLFSCRKGAGSHSTVHVDYDDTRTESFIWDEIDEDLTVFNHTFQEDGDYSVNVKVDNMLGEVNLSCVVSVFDPVLNVTLTADPQSITVNGSIVFSIQVPDGVDPPSRANFSFYTNDSIPAVVGAFLESRVSFTRTFTETGDYLAVATVWNGYNTLTVTQMVHVVPSCRNLHSFNFTKVIQVNKTTSFNVTLSGAANELCLTFLFTPAVGLSQTYWRGSESVCSKDANFDVNKYRNITEGATEVKQRAIFAEETTLNITLTLTTLCHTSSREETANVTSIPCLTLDFITDVINVNGSVPNLPRLYKKKDEKNFRDDFFKLSHDCISPERTCKVFRNHVSGPIEKPDMEVKHKDLIERFVIEGGTYEYGDYNIMCFAKMPNTPNKNSTRLFYFRILESQLHVTINNDAIKVAKGLTDTNSLEAAIMDPDEEDGTPVFSWFCWKKGAEEPSGAEKLETRLSVPQAAAEVPQLGPSETRGCFGGQSGLLDVATSTLTLHGDTQQVETYVIRVTVTLGTRTASDDVDLEVKEQRQLEVSVAIQWTRDGQTQLRADEDAKICAVCEECDASSKYNWTVATGDVSATPDNLSPMAKNKHEAIGDGDCIKLLSASIEPYHQYSFQCIVTGTSGGEGSTKTCSADIPAHGRFEVDPIEGSAIQTKFSFSAPAWTVRNGDGCNFDPPSAVGLKTTYFKKLGVNGEEQDLPTSGGKAALPEGPMNEGNKVYISCQIESTITGIQVVVETHVKVTAPADLSSAVASITITSNGEAIAMMGTLSSMIGIPGSTPGSVPGSGGEQSDDIGAEILAAEQRQKEKMREVMVSMVMSVMNSKPDADTLLAMTQVAASGDLPLSVTIQMAASLSTISDPTARNEIANNVLSATGSGAEKNTVQPEEPTPVDPDAIPDEDAEEAAQLQAEEDRKQQVDAAANVIASTATISVAISASIGENETIVVGTVQLQVTIVKRTPDNMEGQQFDTPGGQITMGKMSSNSSVVITMDIVFSAVNFLSFDKSAKDISTGITMFDLKASDGGRVPYPNLESPIGIGMNLDEGKNNYLNMDNTTVDPKTLLFSVWFRIDEAGVGALILEFQLGVTYNRLQVCLDVYITFNITEDSPKQPSSTSFDYHITLPHSQACNQTGSTRRRKRDVSPEIDWVIVVPEHLIGPPGLTVGVATRIGDDPKPLNATPTDLKIRNAITRCRSWNNLDEEWTTEACVVGEGTTLYSTKCQCGKLTEDVKTFSGGITIPTVNTIDFANIFANFADLLNSNPTVMATLLVLLCSYIVLLIWARHKDRLDIERWGVTPLVDNMPDNTYFFKMSVYTGLRQRAGTKSKICFILAGDSGDTGVRVLDDGRGKFYGRGALRHFVLSTNMSLGPLNFMRVWHDNSGEGAWASWFLDKIILEDLQTKTRFMFLCGRWLAVDEDDGQVDRSLPVAGEEEIDGFEHLFFSTARRNLTDEHLWLSVLSRPTKSHFSRAQRLTCCLTLLFTTMLASAMFYKGTPEQEETAKTDEVIRLGPLVLSVQTLIISIYANLLVVPINLIIVTLFRKSKPRHYIDMGEAEQTALREEMRRQRYLKVETAMSQNDKDKDDDDDEDDKDKAEKGKDKDKKDKEKKKTKKWPKYPLPWWCSVIAWVLAVLSCVASTFIVFMYSLEWGKLVSEEWLSSLLFSFVQSVIVIQPLKVVAVAMLVSLIFKKYTGEEEDEEDELNKAKLADDEELVTAPDVDLNTLSAPAAPSAAALAEARAKAAKEKQMWATVKEVVMYLIFLLLVAFIAWGPRNANMFDMTDNIRGYMAGDDKLNAANNNETIGFLGDTFRFWLWCNTTVVDMLYNIVHYNGDPTTRRDRAFMRDQVSYRVGQIRLRQLRVPPAQCDVPDVMRGIIIECNTGYTITKEEDRNYTAGWFLETANTTEPPANSVELAFKYHSMLDLNGFPLLGQLSTYGGGGYVAALSTSPRRARKALAALMENNWVDYYTRAVIVEFTLYNPNVNLFLHNSYIIEFPPSGSTIPTPKISVFQIYSGVGGMGTAILVAQIIYIFVMLYYMVRAVKTIRKIGSKEYFAEPWNIYEVVVIISSIVCIAMFAMKEAIGRLVTEELANHAGYGSYLQLATYIELVDYTVGFIVFMANIKFLRLLRFNSHVRQLAQTFRLAGKDLLYFGASFFIVFGAFSMSAGSLFGTHLYDFSDFLHTIQALYGIILGKINLVDMGNVHPVLGPTFFLTFLGMVYFVLVNMFVSILTSAYTMVRLGEMKDDEEAVMSLFVQRVKAGLGLEKTQRDTGSGYVEPADLLDRRLDVINTWINEYYKEEAMAKKVAMGKGPKSKTPIKTEPGTRKPSWSGKFNF